MIRLPSARLPKAAAEQLIAWQAAINSLPTHAEKVAEGKAKFSQRNKATDPTFGEVRKTLTRMCCGARRCGYCEDSLADEVEHIRPKDLYPEFAFDWQNYLYACGPCNGPKNNQYALFVGPTNLFTDITPAPRAVPTPPPAGDHVLLNPRVENPMDFMRLDINGGTFRFVPIHPPGSLERQRAEYTIRLCGLNARSALPAARREAYGNYRSRLHEYVIKRDRGDSARALGRLANGLKKMAHPSVWLSMKAQRSLVQELTDIFEVIPEAVNW